MIGGFLGCLDHSPSEQLTGADGTWHTTALALSEGGEISDLCRAIIGKLGGQVVDLRKWHQGRRGNYRTKFANALAEELPNHPVKIFVNSVTEGIIKQNVAGCRNELGIAPLYSTREPVARRRRAVIGPVQRRDTREETCFDLPEGREAMIVWIAHMLLRWHHVSLDCERQAGRPTSSIDLFIYMDNLAGEQVSRDLFNFILQHNVRQGVIAGNIRLSTFTKSDEVDIDLLSDNLAGLFNHAAQGKVDSAISQRLLATGRVHLERGQ
jgi:hypothetical protein